MRMSRISRIAVTGAAASMALATAAPALACQASDTTETKPASQQAGLAQQQAWVDAFVTRSQQQLTALAAKIAADPRLTSAQQSAWTSWIAEQQAKLSELKAAVDAATTVSQLHQAVRSALAGTGWFGWYGAFGAQRDRIATELRWLDSARDLQPRQPVRAGEPSTIKHPDTRTVVLRSWTRDRQATAGQHRSQDAGAWQRDRDYQARHGFGDHRRGSDRDRSGYPGWTQYHR